MDDALPRSNVRGFSTKNAHVIQVKTSSPAAAATASGSISVFVPAQLYPFIDASLLRSGTGVHLAPVKSHYIDKDGRSNKNEGFRLKLRLTRAEFAQLRAVEANSSGSAAAATGDRGDIKQALKPALRRGPKLRKGNRVTFLEEGKKVQQQ